MRTVVTLLIFLPLVGFAGVKTKSIFELSGGAFYCQSEEDIGKVGFILENIQTTYATADEETVEISFSPNFYACAKNVKGYHWKTSTMDAALNSTYKTKDGIVKIVPTMAKWVTYAESYKVLESRSGSNAHLSYIVKKSDLLKNSQDKAYLTTFLSYATKAIYPNGQEVDLGLRRTGYLETLIEFPSR